MPQLSVAVAGPKPAVEVHTPASVLIVLAPGQVIAGAWLSTTVREWLHVSERPLLSVAVQVTVLEPTP
jgi:hypothetical protein